MFKAQLSTPLLAVAPFIPLVLGGWLALTANAVQADVVIQVAQEQSQQPSFTPREFDFQAPVVSPPSTNLESYLVYVNDASSRTLEQVRTLESKAYVRQHHGRSVIQTGVFNKNSNAQQQAKVLQSKGIEARIVNLATGEETELAGSKSYFVVIPGSQEDLPLIEDQVKQLQIEIQTFISQKEQPRGPHVRIGPFSNRGQAERLNRYMLDSGLSNARVYYGSSR